MRSRLTLLMLISILVIGGIFFTANLLVDKTRYRNDFVRVFPAHAADIGSTIKLTDEYLSIAGMNEGSLYLNCWRGVIELSLESLDTCHIPGGNTNGQFIVNSDYFFIQNGNEARLERGQVINWKVDKKFIDIPGFTAIQPISKNVAVLRTVDSTGRKSVFTKTTSPRTYKDILKTQFDGILCTDGHLLYSKQKNVIIYVYRYRNEFVCMDTLLNVTRIGKKIDTTSISKIQVAEVDGKLTMSTPPLIVNKSASVDGNFLFINSNLVARNERPDVVNDRSIIDVYDLYDNSYRFSFYIYDHGKEKMRSFKVQDSILIAVFKNNVTRYDLASKYLKN